VGYSSFNTSGWVISSFNTSGWVTFSRTYLRVGNLLPYIPQGVIPPALPPGGVPPALPQGGAPPGYSQGGIFLSASLFPGGIFLSPLVYSLVETSSLRQGNPLQKAGLHKKRHNYQHPFHCWKRRRWTHYQHPFHCWLMITPLLARSLVKGAHS